MFSMLLVRPAAHTMQWQLWTSSSLDKLAVAAGTATVSAVCSCRVHYFCQHE